jgi:hypothetical protein
MVGGERHHNTYHVNISPSPSPPLSLLSSLSSLLSYLECAVLFGVENLQQCTGRVPPLVPPQLVDFVEQDHRVAGARLTKRLRDEVHDEVHDEGEGSMEREKKGKREKKEKRGRGEEALIGCF